MSAMDAQSVIARPKGTPLVSEVLYPRAAYESEADPKHDERLQNTLHAQPATVAVSVGAFDIMKSAGLQVRVRVWVRVRVRGRVRGRVRVRVRVRVSKASP